MNRVNLLLQVIDKTHTPMGSRLVEPLDSTALKSHRSHQGQGSQLRVNSLIDNSVGFRRSDLTDSKHLEIWKDLSSKIPLRKINPKELHSLLDWLTRKNFRD